MPSFLHLLALALASVFGLAALIGSAAGLLALADLLESRPIMGRKIGRTLVYVSTRSSCRRP
jgi:hypothetical protein